MTSNMLEFHLIRLIYFYNFCLFYRSCSTCWSINYSILKIERLNRFDLDWFWFLPKEVCFKFKTKKIFCATSSHAGKINRDIELKDNQPAEYLRKLALGGDQTHPLMISTTNDFQIADFPFIIIKQERTNSFRERIIMIQIW